MEDITKLFSDTISNIDHAYELKNENQVLELLLSAPVMMNPQLESGLIVFIGIF
jgi:hypothetical protein